MYNVYDVYDEKGGRFQVWSKSEEDAIERYWEGMESIFAHIEESCNCFQNPKPFPRDKYLQPVKVVKLNVPQQN